MQSMLQSFLDAGMLNMVEEDEKLKHLQDTAQDLAAKPPKTRIDVIHYTLVALDPEASPQEPIFEKIETALKKHWQTFKVKFPDMPRQLLRAIIFEALRIRGEKDVATAAIIWWTGANYLPYANLGRERDICREFLMHMGNIAEEQATAEWTSSYEYTPPTISAFEIKLNIKPPVIDEDALTKHLAAASGPNDEAGNETGPDPNPYLPNSPGPWVKKFAPRAATGISEVINNSYATLFKEIVGAIKQAGKDLNESSIAINTAVQNAINQVAQSAEANERRSQLLWWRQTLYSPTLKQSYREMDRATATLLMGYDVYKQVTDYHPQSVEYLLREAARNVITANEAGADTGLSLFEFCRQLQTNDRAAELRQELKAAASDEPGRIPLLRFVKAALAGEPLDADKLTERVGVKSDTIVNFEDLAVWMFRDLQANHLATQKQ